MAPRMTGVIDSSSQPRSSVRVSSSISLSRSKTASSLAVSSSYFARRASSVSLGTFFSLTRRLDLGEGDGLPLEDGDEVGTAEQAHLDLDDGKALRGHLLLEGLEDLPLLLLLGLDEGVALVRVIGALQELGHVRLQHLDELGHRFGEGLARCRPAAG